MKNQKATGIAKSALSAILSLSMAVSGIAVFPAAAIADDEAPAAVKTLNFNKGLAEFNYLSEQGTGDPNFSIVKATPVIIEKVGDEVEMNADGSPHDTVDANNLLYTGSGDKAKYAELTISNQPVTAADKVKGTALVFGDTVSLPELKKEASAAIAGDDTATAKLDEMYAPGAVVREAMTNKSKLYISNPLAGQTADAYTITYWEYLPEGAEEDASLMVFENEDCSIALYADSETIPAAAWTQVAAVFTADGISFYVNGEEVENSYAEVVGTYSVAALTAPVTLAFGGSDNVTVNTLFDSRIDDAAFYAQALTAEEIKAAYDREAATLNPTVDVNSPDAVYSLSDASQFTDIGEDSVTIEETTIGGKTVKAAHVAANTSQLSKAGLMINENPFACSDGSLEGVTIGYWYKQEINKRVTNYYTMLVMDSEKYIYNAANSSASGNGRSKLYVDDQLTAGFTEGETNGNIKGSLKNQFTFSPDADSQAELLKNCVEWHYITLVATNAGMQMYIDGQKYENAAENVYGPRFSDGYYNHVDDRSDPVKLFGVFGGTDNQRATQLMTFFGYEDTRLYFGWQPVDETTNTRTSGSWVYNVSCYRGAMTDEDVAALYAKEINGEQPGPSEDPVTVVYGDVNGSGKVEASDALCVLKHVVKLNILNETEMKAADVDGVAGVSAADALCILKYVVKLIDKFPVEK